MKERGGYTLVEISVALGVITLLALITIPTLVNYQRTAKLRNEARSMATNLRLAQQLAITEQNIYRVEFSVISNSYQVVNDATNDVRKIVDLAEGVIINQIDSLTANTAKFNPTGAAVEVGIIYLVTSNQTTTVEIKPSGYVQINEQF